MEMKRVYGSSAIVAVGYEPDTEQMEVQFSSGRRYTHEGVPSSVYEAFISSDSLGSFYANQIKGQY